MTLNHPTIQKKLQAWQTELRMMTGNESMELYAIEESPKRSLADVQQAIAEATEIDLSRVMKRTRKSEIVEARQLLCYCMRRMCKMKYSAIGYFFDLDHSTIIHSENEVIERLRKGDPDTVQVLKKVQKFFEEKSAA
jgi:chromosomal replication initiation ATPase DnaA